MPTRLAFTGRIVRLAGDIEGEACCVLVLGAGDPLSSGVLAWLGEKLSAAVPEPGVDIGTARQLVGELRSEARRLADWRERGGRPAGGKRRDG